MSKSLQPYKPGSLAEIAGGITANPHKMAMALKNADLLVLVDCSSSMSQRDAGPNADQVRHDAAQECLDILQNEFPGRIAVGAFNSESHGLIHTGVLPKPAGSTPLSLALDFFFPKVKAMGMKFVVISDGEPDDPAKCISIGKREAYPTYCIFVGDRNDPARGQDFLRRLSEVTGGTFDHVTLDNIKLLTQKIAGYLGTGSGNTQTTAAQASA